ncbi:MAG: 30S ribosomal protein S7 [Euryarchaeota archaeon]|jgi:small subunit ribosomal protein S7|nr:30S ribosomal protein S7 [Euryarchaeota archaeon]|tara:strand:- start:1174 stop:1812 length:639 start_codon:yes stop_codon:yes gene_type:complete
MTDEEINVDEVLEEEPVIDESPIAGLGTLVFGKWDTSEVICADPGLSKYINLKQVGTPHTGGKHANTWFGKSKLSLSERYINNLMRSGKYTGKKQSATKAFRVALDEINKKTDQNPLQIFVDAIINSAQREEITRIRFGAVSQPKAVDSSPSRRLDTAIRNLAKGATQGTSKSKRSLKDCIVNELIKASNGDATSFAISKKEEIERIAASAR